MRIVIAIENYHITIRPYINYLCGYFIVPKSYYEIMKRLSDLIRLDG